MPVLRTGARCAPCGLAMWGHRHVCAVAMGKGLSGAAGRAVVPETHFLIHSPAVHLPIGSPNACPALGSQSKGRAPAGNERVPPHPRKRGRVPRIKSRLSLALATRRRERTDRPRKE